MSQLWSKGVGDAATAFRPGDEVFGVGNGTFAEYATARTDKIAPKPANLGFEEAAKVPTTGCTALQGIHDVGKVRWGQSVWLSMAPGWLRDPRARSARPPRPRERWPIASTGNA